MAYWLDDGFDTWPETIRAGAAAAGLYVRCGAWIARNLTDGYVPGEVAAMYGTTEWTRKLLDVGLWEVDGHGYRDVRYFAMGNPTAETVTARRAQKAERQRRWLEKQRAENKTRGGRVRDASQGASRDVPRDLPPALPPSKGGAGGAREERRAAPVLGDATRQRAAEARAAIRKPQTQQRRGDAFAELVTATQPPSDETSEDPPESNIIPLRA